MSMFPATSISLLERARDRQQDAWHRLVELYGPLVYHWCRRCQLASEDAADVFQEVFQAVARDLPRFRRDRPGDTFRGWLRIITQNKIRDLFRQRADSPEALGGSDAQRWLQAVPDPSSTDAQEDVVRAQQVRQALAWVQADFTESTWRAFWLVRLENRDTAEVAAQLGMTTAAVRKACYRVQERLRAELEGLGM